MRAAVVEREVEVGGRPTRYLAGGEGPPLVLLHGTGTNGREWAWSLPALARGRSVYAPDMPGFDGGGPVANPSPENYAAFVAAFLDTLGLGPAAVVGNSFGGLVALRLALSEPSRVPALALVDSVGLRREVSPALVAPTAPGLGELTLRWGQTPAGAAQRAYSRAPLLFANPGRVPREWYEEQYRAAQTPGFMETTFATLRAHLGPFGQLEVLLGELPRLRMPTLVVWGAWTRSSPRPTPATRPRGSGGASWQSSPAAATSPTSSAPKSSPPSSARSSTSTPRRGMARRGPEQDRAPTGGGSPYRRRGIRPGRLRRRAGSGRGRCKG